MHKRLRAVCIEIGGLLGAGLFYTFIYILVGRSLAPCLSRTVIGLYYPGCGVSRTCLPLLRLDFASAFQANATLLPLLLPGLFIAVWMAVRYIRTGSARFTRVQACVFYVMIGVLLVFGVMRSLPGFGWLRP